MAKAASAGLHIDPRDVDEIAGIHFSGMQHQRTKEAAEAEREQIKKRDLFPDAAGRFVRHRLAEEDNTSVQRGDDV